MATYDLGKVVGDAGEKGDDGSSVWNTSTAPTYANSKYTFTISNLSGKTGLQIAVNDIIFYSTYYYIVSAVNSTTVDCSTRVSIKGSDASVTIVDNLTSTSSTSALSAKQGKVLNDNKIETSSIATSFGSTPSDSKVASEKLVKNSLDAKQATLVSGTNIKTVNNNSLLGSGNITIESGSNVDIVTNWEQTLSDAKVPSEKLAKTSLDGKVDKVTGKGLSTNDFTNSYKSTIDGLSTVATTGDYDDLTDKPTIPSKISDLTNDSDFIETSSTSGLIKNDGTVDTTSYSTFSGSYNDLSGKPTIPSASTTTPSADTTSGSYGSGTNYARSNHTHPKSSLYAEATHSHTKSQITDFPTIPTNTSDLTNDGADGTNVFVANNDSRLSDARTPTSHTHGQITNAGTITSTAVTVASGDNIVITDASDSSKVKRVTNLLAGHIKDSTAHTNIGSSANDTQATINSDIDTALSNKVSKSSTSGLLKNDGSVDTTAYSTFDGNYNSLTNKPTIPTIPTNVSAFTNDVGYLTQHQSLANYIQKSSTSGLLKNDGTVDTTSYLSSLPSHTHDGRYYTESEMDSLLNNKLDVEDAFSGSYNDLSDVPTSFNPSSHNHSISDVSNLQTSLNAKLETGDVGSAALSNDYYDLDNLPSLFDGDYDSLTNKPSIPSSSSDLSDGSNIVKKSSTTGLLKNDGTVMESGTGASNYSAGNHTHNSQISYGKVDSTSTSTVFTATVPNLTSLVDGTTVMLRNGVVTSASGFTLNVNGLGAKPVYNSMADASADTTIFNINYTMLFVYDSTRVTGGCWICYRGYNSDTNTIGHQIRTNSQKIYATDKTYRYRILLEVDDTHYMPVNLSTSTSADVSKTSTMNTREFKLGGNIIYYSYTSAVNQNAQFGNTYQWKQYPFSLGFSFNNTNTALELTQWSPVYMVAEKSTNEGMAKLVSPYYTQSLPNSEDGKLYIFLGQAYSTTNIEMVLEHPIYEYKNGRIRLYRDYYTTSEIDTLLSGKANSSHTHTKSQITDFPSTMTPSAHTHNYSDVNGVSTVPVTVTYTNNTTETINLLKYTSS